MATMGLSSIKFRNSISTRLLKIVLSIYFAVTFFVTAAHIFIEYDAVKKDVKSELTVIQKTFEASLATALWHLDREQLSVAVNGIVELPTITGIQVFELNKEVLIESGDVIEGNAESVTNSGLFWHDFPLRYQFGEDNEEIGYARLYSSNLIVWNRIELGFIILIVSAVIKTIVLCVLIIVVFDRLLSRPLGRLAHEAEGIDPDNIKERRIFIETTQGNELKVLETALNGMMDKVVASLAALDDMNKGLEEMVRKRTESLNEVIVQLDSKQKDLEQEIEIRKEREQELENSRRELQISLDNLRRAQKQLIESEKMASLGSLVAGVAHEINTPIGLSLTGITHFEYMVERLEATFKAGELEEDDFVKFMDDTKELAKSIVISLRRAADLVKSFKQVAVDQTHEALRAFNLRTYVEEVLLSLRNRIKQTHIKVHIDCEPHLMLTGFPGIWSQIITNFVSNSLLHGYDQGDQGNIQLQFVEEGEYLIFNYHDDGKGMTAETSARVFDPFFTTNREGGGTGLGMNIIYNLVTQKMGGSISVESAPGKGVHFTIKIKTHLTAPAAEVENV